MGTEPHLSDSIRGYLSAQSKQRFTVVAGVLGFAFFAAQIVLPIVLMFSIMFPVIFSQEVASADLEQAVIWNGQLWFVEEAHKPNWRAPSEMRTTRWLRHAVLADLSPAPDRVPLASGEDLPALLPQGNRLWLLGSREASYCEAGRLTVLRGAARPRRASRPFLHEGRPTVVTHGRTPQLAALHVDGTQAEWRSQPLALNLPPDADRCLSGLEALQGGQRLFLIAELAREDCEPSALRYREIDEAEWRPLGEPPDWSRRWAAVAVDGRPALLTFAAAGNRSTRVAMVTVDEAHANVRRDIGTLEGRVGWLRWHAHQSATGVILVSDMGAEGRRLAEIAGGRIVRSVRTGDVFPFGGHMMAFMVVPQLLPFLLSIVLALVLTGQMRKHRVQTYVAEDGERTFASLWQRAWAQVVDALVLGAGLLAPFAWMWRMSSDPERFMEDKGPSPLVFFGLLALGFVWMLGVLVLFSYWEGRYGKTPGKWLMGIRVLGTDLRPCGFRRALVRNVLTFVDGFFNFLIGILLVALTENWQRLGDLAARTLVVTDESGHGSSVPAPTKPGE